MEKHKCTCELTLWGVGWVQCGGYGVPSTQVPLCFLELCCTELITGWKVKGLMCTILWYSFPPSGCYNVALCVLHLLRLHFRTLILVNKFLQRGLTVGFISSLTINPGLSPFKWWLFIDPRWRTSWTGVFPTDCPKWPDLSCRPYLLQCNKIAQDFTALCCYWTLIIRQERSHSDSVGR